MWPFRRTTQISEEWAQEFNHQLSQAFLQDAYKRLWNQHRLLPCPYKKPIPRVWPA